MQWALRDPLRFLKEHNALERFQKEASWLVALEWRISATVVEVDLDYEIHGNRYAVTLTYPDLFPDTPAYIRPRDAAEHWSIHQYGPGGSFCLEWRADNWQRTVTGADLAVSLHRLLETEKHPEKPARVPSAHLLTEGQQLRSSDYRLVVTPNLIEAAGSIAEGFYRKLRKTTLLHSPATVAFISKMENESGAVEVIGDLPTGIASYFPLFAWSEDGLALRSAGFDGVSVPASFDELKIFAHKGGFDLDSILVRDKDSKIASQTFLIIGSDPRGLRCVAVNAGVEMTVQKYDVIFPDSIEHRLPVEAAQLGGLRIGIVGLGSIGSKVAISLARSGARRFLLVDDDYMAAENVCRHELSWAAVGTNKIDAIREALTLVAPNLEVKTLSHRVAGQESALSAAAVLKDLSNCDLLVDATAEPEVFLRLAAIAKLAKKPLCWAEVYAGGIGGMIARARPDIDPNPLAVRDAYISHTATLPSAPFQLATGYDVQAQRPLTAHDSDVTLIASAFTRLILDTAVRRDESIFPFSLYMIGLREGWAFTQPFQTFPIDAKGADWNADSAGGTEEERKAAFEMLAGLILKDANADAST